MKFLKSAGGELQSKIIVGVVGLVGAYVVYRFLKSEISGGVSAGIDNIAESLKNVGKNTYDATVGNFATGVAAIGGEASKITGVTTGNAVADSLVVGHPVGWVYATNKIAYDNVKKGVNYIYDWITNSDDDPKTNVVSEDYKTVNGIPIYLAKPSGTPNTVFTLESLSKDIPFLH